MGIIIQNTGTLYMYKNVSEYMLYIVLSCFMLNEILDEKKYKRI